MADQPVRIVIDGPSGSGKTTLANKLGSLLDVRVLSVEDWVPGWDGLTEGTAVTEELLRGERDSYTRWDWVREGYAEEVVLDPAEPWIIEGCGALTPTTAANATLSIWVEADPQEARARGLARDGELYAPFWEQWNRAEREHWVRNSPRTLADLVIKT